MTDISCIDKNNKRFGRFVFIDGKKEIEKRLNARVRYRSCQNGFKNDAPPHNFFPTPSQYSKLIKEGKDKAVFLFYKGKEPLVTGMIVAYPLSIIKEIIQLESEKMGDFEKYQENSVLPLISEHRINKDRPFYIDLEKVQLMSEYCFKDEDDFLKNHERIF